jgi:hypothetical protein
LVSAEVLRSWGAGQCDLVRFFPAELRAEIAEVKGASVVGHLQRARLAQAAMMLSRVLGANVVWRRVKAP